MTHHPQQQYPPTSSRRAAHPGRVLVALTGAGILLIAAVTAAALAGRPATTPVAPTSADALDAQTVDLARQWIAWQDEQWQQTGETGRRSTIPVARAVEMATSDCARMEISGQRRYAVDDWERAGFIRGLPYLRCMGGRPDWPAMAAGT